MSFDYESLLEIDKFKLDEEWMEQPTKYAKLSEQYSEAMLERDRLKDELDLTYSEIYAKLIAGEDKKPSDKSLECLILKNKVYQRAKQKFNEQVHTVNVVKGVLTALEQRKTALEYLCRLMFSEYYSDPNVKGSVGQMMKEAETQAFREMAAKTTDSRVGKRIKKS